MHAVQYPIGAMTHAPRSGERKDVSVGGGGGLDYARVRKGIRQTTVDAGWQFRLEGAQLS